MTNQFIIRKTSKKDVPVIFALVKSLAKYEKLSDEVTATESNFQKFGFGEHVYFKALLADDKDGNSVGFALYYFTFSTFRGKPTLHLEDLFVLAEYRGQGIGKALLKKLAEIAVKNNCGRMEWAVLDWNKPAIKFYESIAAFPLNDWLTYRLLPKDVDNLMNS